MAHKVNIHEAKTNLSKLIEYAARGEEVVIAKAGEPVARLVPCVAARRKPGIARGRGRLTKDFFVELPKEVLKQFGYK
ncbi:MAG: type II toxin-antitoxin system Phd/YefM family antitoxin [Burkholderiaceae bacterium]